MNVQASMVRPIYWAVSPVARLTTWLYRAKSPVYGVLLASPAIYCRGGQDC